MKSWTEHRERYEELLGDVVDVAKLTTKDHWIWRGVAWSLALASFGNFSRSRFMTRFATTFGPIQAYPREWSEISEEMIIHESRHTQQFLFAGWFVPLFGWVGRKLRVWVGVLPMAVVYGFFPLPIFFAWGRMRLELDADAYVWRQGLREGWMSPDDVRVRAQDFAETVASWAYLRSWPSAWTVRAFLKRAEYEISLGGFDEEI